MFFLENRNKHPTFLVSCTHKNNFMVEKKNNAHTGKATKGKVQDIGEVNKVMPLPLPSSDRVRG